MITAAIMLADDTDPKAGPIGLGVILALVVVSVVICYRLERSRVGRAWMAMREDEIAAKAMGINIRNMKLLAFGMGATFGGVSGTMFASFQGFISPESFSLQESIVVVAMVVLGGLGHIPGVIVGALLLAALPEVLRYVAGPLQAMTDGRLDSAILRQLMIALAMISEVGVGFSTTNAWVNVSGVYTVFSSAAGFC